MKKVNNVENMTTAEVLEGLEDLINDRESLIMEENDIFAKDKQILQEAIRIIKGAE